MQKNTKEPKNKNLIKNENNKTVAKTDKVSISKSNTSKKTSTKKNTAKKTVKNTTVKKSTTKKSTSKSTAKKTATKKVATTKKTTSPRKASKIVASSKNKSKTKSKKVDILEYYDLPYRYNQTVVKTLAQTPTTLFVYWDISDSDREKYIQEFGKNFFENTVPVLIIHNKTMNYSYEIEINDFANSWYFNVEDANCNYEIEIGRRAKNGEISLPNNYMHITSSNVIEAPNDHILFEKNQSTIFFRNVKTNAVYSKHISTFNFMQYIGKIYNIYDIYKQIYKKQELENLGNMSSSNF